MYRPYASSNPCFQGAQHAFRPHRRFRPGPAGSDFSGLRSPYGHCRRSRLHRWFRHAFHLPAALRSTGVTPFPRYYGRSDSCPLGSSSAAGGMNTDLPGTGLPDSCTRPSPRSVANHQTGPVVAFARYPSARRTSSAGARVLRWGDFVLMAQVWASPFPSGLAVWSGRIAFVILQTESSRPVASDPASRRRPDFRLQAGERLPEGDSHPSDWIHSQAHWDQPSSLSPTGWKAGSTQPVGIGSHLWLDDDQSERTSGPANVGAGARAGGRSTVAQARASACCRSLGEGATPTPPANLETRRQPS